MSTATTQRDRHRQTWTIDTVHSHVGFAVKHMVVATFRGRFDELRRRAHRRRGRHARASRARSTSTRSSSRTRTSPATSSPRTSSTARSHPRDQLRLQRGSRSTSGGELEVEGELTIKGHTHRVTARGSISGPHVDIAGNDKLGVELEAIIDRREYGLEWNAPLPKGGFALDNDVKLEVSLELVREA